MYYFYSFIQPLIFCLLFPNERKLDENNLMVTVLLLVLSLIQQIFVEYLL